MGNGVSYTLFPIFIVLLLELRNEIIKYFISPNGNRSHNRRVSHILFLQKRGIELSHLTCNASRIRRKVENGMF